LIPRHWQFLDSIPPDAETSRWITADWAQQKIIRRYRENHGAPRDTTVLRQHMRSHE
jgi:hypothetical protein